MFYFKLPESNHWGKTSKMAIEIEEPTLFENILQYGLFAAAIFQIICIMAAIFIPKSESEQVIWHRKVFRFI